jgi:mono/diheme cytochrome c family protein
LSSDLAPGPVAAAATGPLYFIAPEVQMKRNTLLFVGVFSAGFFQATAAWAADSGPGGQRDLVAEVRAVFTAKCAGCHGPTLAKPRGRFGYVLDLARVASNREMVVPSSPKESELWELVSRGEMPPPDSPTGALTADQKELIRTWIAAGAPAVSSAASQIGVAEAPVAIQGNTQPTTSMPHATFLEWIGRFHLLFLHFPIALMLAAAAAESWSIVLWSRFPSPAVRYSVFLAAIAVLATVPLGWLHALSVYGDHVTQALTLHRVLGTAAGCLVFVAAVGSELDARRGKRSLFTRAALLAGAVLVASAAHFGGILAHGAEFFRW